MNSVSSLVPVKKNMLVAFCDLTLFVRVSNTLTLDELLEFLNDLYATVGDCIEPNGGQVVKFIGDAALVIFDEDHVSEGVIALKTLKETVDKKMTDKGYPSRLGVKVHFGEVICGEVGTKKHRAFDVFGETVNTAAMLKANGMAISAQVFRKLDSDTRTLFKKHTPPITYIPVETSHRD